MAESFAGAGGKRPLIYADYQRLLLDSMNPRLPLEAQGQKEEAIQTSLKRHFYLEELAQSMSVNGYFDEEPLVGVPEYLPEQFDKPYEELKDNEAYKAFIADSSTNLIIVEGNRRLCTVKLLLAGETSSFPEVTGAIREDLKNLPVIVYPRRKEVISYLGVRHIVGIKKWDAYAKARYIASMRNDYHLSIDELQQSVGDQSNSARKTYVAYRLIEVMEENFEYYDTSKSKDNFSYLMLALGQGSIKDFIGLPKQWNKVDLDNPIDKGNLNDLFLLFSWLFGEGKEKPKVIAESRDITGKLTTVISDPDAVEYLKDYRDLNESYERCGGEALLLIKYLKRTKRDLGRCLPLASLYWNDEADTLLRENESLINSIKAIPHV